MGRKMTKDEKQARRDKKEAKRIADNLKRDCENHHEADKLGRIAEPTLHFKEGDRVQHGNVHRSFVEKVEADGKILLLNEIVQNENYGNPYFSSRHMWVTWHDLKPYRIIEDMEAIPRFEKNEDLQIHFQQRTVSSIIGLMHGYLGGINLDPVYQRGLVWDMEDKLSLIRSMFNNADIGKFVFVHLPYAHQKESYEVLDGKQRINCLVEFIEGRWDYEGVNFFDLHWRDQHHIKESSISWADVSDINLEQKLRYFLMLNLGGKPVDPDHLAYIRKMHREEVKKNAKK